MHHCPSFPSPPIAWIHVVISQGIVRLESSLADIADFCNPEGSPVAPSLSLEGKNVLAFVSSMYLDLLGPRLRAGYRDAGSGLNHILHAFLGKTWSHSLHR